MKPYSLDLRERVAAAAAVPNVPLWQVAVQFAVSKSFVEKLRARQLATGSVAALPRGRGPAPLLDATAHQTLGALLEAQPDATLVHLREALAAATHPLVSSATLCHLLQRLGWNRKKKQSTPPSATASG
jgi:transposase